MTNTTNHPTSAPWRSTLRRILPFAWLGLSAAWAAVIFVTDHLAWPLALWIATTVAPLTAIERRTSDRRPAAD